MSTTVTSSQLNDWVKRLSASVPHIDSYIVGLLIQRQPEALAAILDEVEAYASKAAALHAMPPDAVSAQIDRNLAQLEALHDDRVLRWERLSVRLDRRAGLRSIDGGREA